MKKIIITLIFTLFMTGCSSSRKPLICEIVDEGGTSDMYQSIKVIENGDAIESITIVDKYVIKDNYINMIDEFILKFDQDYMMYENVDGIHVDKEKKNDSYIVTIYMDFNKLDNDIKNSFNDEYKNVLDLKEELESEKYSCSYKY